MKLGAIDCGRHNTFLVIIDTDSVSKPLLILCESFSIENIQYGTISKMLNRLKRHLIKCDVLIIEQQLQAIEGKSNYNMLVNNAVGNAILGMAVGLNLYIKYSNPKERHSIALDILGLPVKKYTYQQIKQHSIDVLKLHYRDKSLKLTSECHAFIRMQAKIDDISDCYCMI